MGDLIETETRAQQGSLFYRISSSRICFELKTNGGAVIGLAKEPGRLHCQYWCGFTHGGKIWIKGPDGIKSRHHGKASISPKHFNKFWVAWDHGILRVGKGTETVYMQSYKSDVDIDVNYITFAAHDERSSATWRFRLPPVSLINLRKHEPFEKIQEGKLKWLPITEHLPEDAVIGGFEGECLYISRSPYRGSITPGKFVPSEGVAYIPWGGAANVGSHLEILCGFDYKWVASKEDMIPINALVAGISEVYEEKLFIGRVHHMNNIVPGKVQPSHKVCYIPFGDKELAFKDYEILTVPECNEHGAGKFLMANSGMTQPYFFEDSDEEHSYDETDEENNGIDELIPL